MSQDSQDDFPSDDAARMLLEPDTVHEGEEGPYLDCPQCGSQAPITQIIEEGRCNGYLEPEDVEVEDNAEDLQEGGCTAKLSLELVWEDQAGG